MSLELVSLTGADDCVAPESLAALSEHGYSDALINKIAYENWLALLTRTWGG